MRSASLASASDLCVVAVCLDVFLQDGWMTTDETDDRYQPDVSDVVLRQLPAGTRRCDLDFKGALTVIHNGVELETTGWVLRETSLGGPAGGATTWYGEAEIAERVAVGTHIYVIAGPLRGVAVVDFSTPRKVSFQDATPA